MGGSWEKRENGGGVPLIGGYIPNSARGCTGSSQQINLPECAFIVVETFLIVVFERNLASRQF